MGPGSHDAQAHIPAPATCTCSCVNHMVYCNCVHLRARLSTVLCGVPHSGNLNCSQVSQHMYL